MENPIPTGPRRPRSLFALLGFGFWLTACGGFSCGESQSTRPLAPPNPEPPQTSRLDPVAAAEAEHPTSTDVSHELAPGGEDPHDHTQESGDHALELDELHGHAPTAVSEDKDRIILDRLGVRRLPLEDREPEEH